MLKSSPGKCFFWRGNNDFLTGDDEGFISNITSEPLPLMKPVSWANRLYCMNQPSTEHADNSFLLIVENETKDQDLIVMTLSSGESDNKIRYLRQSGPRHKGNSGCIDADTSSLCRYRILYPLLPLLANLLLFICWEILLTIRD